MAPATKEGPRTAIGGSCSGIADSPTNQTTLVEYDGVIYIDDDDEVQQLLVSTTTTTSTSIESDQMKHRHLATSFCPPTQLTAPNINNTNNNNNINNKHNDTSMQCTSTKPKQPIQQQQHQQYVARKESDCEDFVIIVDSDSDDATIDSDFADDHQEKKKKKKKRAFSELSTNDDDDDDEEAEHKGSADDFSGTQAEYVFDGDNVQFVLDNNDNDSDSDSDYPSAEEEEESEDNAMGGGIVIDSHALKDKDKRIKTQQKLLKLNIEFTGPGLFEDAAFEWVGLPLEQSPLTDDDDTNDDDDDDNNNNNNNNVTKKTVRTQYYSQFMRDGELYKIGDYVYLLPPEEYGDDPYWICRVTELFEDPETREKMLRGFWMWRSFDVRQVDVVEHDPHELFLVEDTQESNSLQTVCGKCTVVYVRDPEEFAPYRDLDDHFYCTSLYDPSSKTIKPLTKQQIAKYNNNNNNKDEKEQQTRPYVRPRALDLFSGCGGLSHGFEQAGVDVAWAVEINASAAASFRLNHPMTNMFNVDVLHFYKHLVFMHELRDKYFDADEPLVSRRFCGSNLIIAQAD